jgi:hypothetical protein
MAQVKSYRNASCLKCKKVEKEMVAIGPMIFCPKCFDEEFKDVMTDSLGGKFSSPALCYWVDSQSKYFDWLKKYQGEFEDGVVH